MRRRAHRPTQGGRGSTDISSYDAMTFASRQSGDQSVKKHQACCPIPAPRCDETRSFPRLVRTEASRHAAKSRIITEVHTAPSGSGRTGPSAPVTLSGRNRGFLFIILPLLGLRLHNQQPGWRSRGLHRGVPFSALAVGGSEVA